MAKRDLATIALELEEALNQSQSEIERRTSTVTRRVVGTRNPALIRAYELVMAHLDTVTQEPQAVQRLEKIARGYAPQAEKAKTPEKPETPASDAYFSCNRAIRVMEEFDRAQGREVKGTEAYRWRLQRLARGKKIRVKKKGCHLDEINVSDLQTWLERPNKRGTYTAADRSSSQSHQIPYTTALAHLRAQDEQLGRPVLGETGYRYRMRKAEQKGIMRVVKKGIRIVSVDESDFRKVLDHYKTTQTRPVLKGEEPNESPGSISLSTAVVLYADAHNEARKARGQPKRPVKDYRAELDYALRRNAFTSEVRENNEVYVNQESLTAYIAQQLGQTPRTEIQEKKTRVRHNAENSLMPVIETRMQGRENTMGALNIVLGEIAAERGENKRTIQGYRLAYKAKHDTR